MFNWRPVYDIEQRSIASEKRTKLIESEIERLAALESRLDALLLNFDSSSPTQHETGSN